jgi:Uma2 family endonuclease
MAIEKIHTLEEFDRLIELPENADKRLEFIDGEIIEVPSNPYSSQIAMLFVYFIQHYLMQKPIGFLTGEGAGYMIGGWRLSPDVAYVSKARQESLAKRGYNPIAPDLVVEVVSPTDEQWQIRRKLGIYGQAGVFVWLVYPERKIVELYAPNEPVVIMDENSVLNGGDILPGFTLSPSDIWR